MRAHAWIALCIVAATFAVYAPVRGHEFVSYDDSQYVYENPKLAEPLGWDAVVRDFTEPYAGNWIPLVWVSLRLNHAASGLEPPGYLLTNVALHAASAVLLFLALARMTGDTGRSAFVAGLFALHPLHVESVAWASERKDTLSGLFWMATIYAWAGYARSPAGWRYGATLLWLALGLAAKPMTVTLPFVLLLLDVWPLRRVQLPSPDPRALRRVLIEKLPLLGLALAAAAATFAVQGEAGSMHPVEALPIADRLGNALRSYAVYLLQSAWPIWPVELAAFYPHPLSGISWLEVGAAAALLGVVSAWAFRGARARPAVLVGWLWYLGTLVPVIGFVQVGMQAHADRYMYLPQIGLSLMLAWGIPDDVFAAPRPRRRLAIAAGTLLALLAILSNLQVRTWRDAVTLYERIVAVSPDSYASHHHLGDLYRERGRFEDARRHYAMSIQLAPTSAPPQLGLARVELGRGDLDSAIGLLRGVLRLAPEDPDAAVTLGIALLRANRHGEARAVLEAFVASPGGASEPRLSAIAQMGLGEIALARGDTAAASRHYGGVLAFDPDHPGAHIALGEIALGRGDDPGARRHYERALARGQRTGALIAGLAELARRQGDLATAERGFREALAIDPESTLARAGLARLDAGRSLPATRRDPRPPPDA